MSTSDSTDSDALYNYKPQVKLLYFKDESS